jgi:hypothetical protein
MKSSPNPATPLSPEQAKQRLAQAADVLGVDSPTDIDGMKAALDMYAEDAGISHQGAPGPSRAPDDGSHGLSAQQLAICRETGCSPREFARLRVIRATGNGASARRMLGLGRK